jgi:hypothetical protein
VSLSNSTRRVRGTRRIKAAARSRDERSFAVAALCMLVCFASLSVVWAQSVPLGEYQLKAVFLYNFAKFIDWPASSFATPQSPFSFCVLGMDPFGGMLDATLSGKTVAGHPLTIERLKYKGDARHCQVVFVSSSEVRNYGDILDSLRGTSALVVGETGGFAASGGIIEFTVEDAHVRFTINPDAAERAGLKVSSKLLALATIVHGENRPNGG